MRLAVDLELAMGEWTAKAAGLAAFVDGLGDAFLLVDADGIIRHANAAAADILDQPPNQPLVGLDIRKILIESPEAHAAPNTWQASTVRRPLGQIFRCDVGITSMDLDGAPWRLVALRHQKTEFDPANLSVDVLCSRFGHQFANLLTPLMGYIELSRLDLDPQSETAEMMGAFMNISRRMLVHVQNLLMVRHRPDPIFHPVEIKTLIGDAIRAAKETGLLADHVVTVRPQGPSDPIFISAEADLLVLLLQNLLMNAAESMKVAGTIEVTLARIENSVEIRVSDTGSGIPREIRERVYEPFFSTKANGRGIGLGLYVSRLIVERHHGLIRISSNVPRGSVISVQLPLATN